jgi:hypothetical protein
MNGTDIRLAISNLKVTHPELVEDDEAWLATLESETDFNEVLTDIVRRIEDAKALAVGTAGRLQELQARKGRFEYRVHALREFAFRIMQSAELHKIELAEATLSIRAGTPQLIGEVDAEALLPEYRKIQVSPDRTAIKEALKAGRTVPGYTLSNAQPSLIIRIK